jgi:hypothetical protein
MKRTPFYFFRKPDVAGRMKQSRYRVQLEDLPQGAEIIPETVEWRNLPESPDEYEHTSAWQKPKG